MFVAIGAAFVVAIQSWLMLQLFRQNGRLLLRMDQLERQLGVPELAKPVGVSRHLPLGSTAPPFELRVLAGSTVSLGSLCEGRGPVVLVFVDSRCGSCVQLIPELAAWRSTHNEMVQMAVVGHGTEGRAIAASSLPRV